MAKKTHEQYIAETKKVEPNIEILGVYTGSLDHIHARCRICNNEWYPVAHTILRGTKCPKCHCKEIDKNNPKLIGNMYPEYAKWLLNKEDAFKYTFGVRNKVDWICPNCGEIVESIAINKVIGRKHVPCRKCSDGVSYPNKYMYSMLKQIGIEFETEYSPEWISPKRYDFYIQSKNLIIEMDGPIGHKDGKNYTGGKVNNDLLADTFKDESAFNHGLDVIRIDSKISDSDYISKNILNSKLSLLFNLSLVDWNLCNKDAYSSLRVKTYEMFNDGKATAEIMSALGLSNTTVCRYLHDATNYGLCNYSAEESYKRVKRDYASANIFRIPVMCIDTGEVFKSIRDANKWLGHAPTGHSIQDNCKGITMTAGKHPITKERLHWKYVEQEMEVC